MRLQSKFDIYNTKIKGSLATQPSNPAKYQKQATTMKDVSKVYILLHTDPNNSLTTSVLGVFASLQDANDECLSQARAAGVTLETEYPSMGPNKEHIIPVQPARWDTAEGTSCWVEAFEVTPQRVKSPDAGAFQ